MSPVDLDEPQAWWVLWRHPRPRGAEGRCIGRTDLPVDPRRAKRLAHRIRRVARREGWPREIRTSPLRRGADVGRWLRRWGWTHVIDARLQEMDFGTWDGRRWSELGEQDFAPWDADFMDHAPGSGESVRQLRTRVVSLLREDLRAPTSGPGSPRLVVGHAGWINALRTLHQGELQARQWPAPLAYAQRIECRVHPT